ncbi:hypothetical protein QBC38DRAFT_494034 [Podospora fimiseda]|uniref:Uncharacterized protein n=1 Tax=Podospora fimiseda TaxID=252190 RepID=A0AAN6YM63_9PEZI|nr:hypothetical protein QBC38DRAFT_494034 [Podospora fimiseda]
MSSPAMPLNNAHLREMPFPSTLYNKLPHINDMHDAAANHARAHAVLLGIIAAHGVAETFSVHLIHKHFDLPDGRIMVYETVKGTTTHQDFVLCSPRPPEKCSNARGLYFKASAGGDMVAYEFTTDPGADLAAHEGFVAAFSKAAIEMGVQDVFALTAMSICPQNKILTEFELAQALSTILVSDASWLPAGDVTESTTTDWLADQEYAQYADGSVPGIIQLKCTRTRSQSHYNVTCSTTRNGSHLGHTPNPFPEAPEDSVLIINGTLVDEGSKPHAIISQALKMVDVVY